MLLRIHSGHMGIEKCLTRARDIMFWPKMSTDTTSMVLSCPICLEFRNSNQKEPLVSHEIPDYPWQNVATDLFRLSGQDYIVVVYYFSRYFELERLHNTNSTTVASSPRYSQSNGLAERILKKAQSSGKDPYISVLAYRHTPLFCGYSPAQLLKSRREISFALFTELTYTKHS